MNLFVDTSVWSQALRRDRDSGTPEVGVLLNALDGHDTLFITGLVLQELLQGFAGPRSRDQIIDRFSAIPTLVPERRDHVEAAELRNRCRRTGIQVGTVDALIAQLCIRHGLTLLTMDDDFRRIANREKLRLWRSASAAH